MLLSRMENKRIQNVLISFVISYKTRPYILNVSSFEWLLFLLIVCSNEKLIPPNAKSYLNGNNDAGTKSIRCLLSLITHYKVTTIHKYK